MDYKGIPITIHSECRPFCTLVRKDPQLVKSCHKCDSRGGLEAVRQNAPYIYNCHNNIVDIAVPISVEGNYIGALMAGQVRLPNTQTDELEQIYKPTNRYLYDDCNLQNLYYAIPQMSLEKVRVMANMLFSLSNYIVEEAINKSIIKEMYEKLLPLKQSIRHELDPNITSLEQIKSIKNELDSVITNVYLNTSQDQIPSCKNTTLCPAFEYIKTHKGEHITQEQMAKLCHVSTSHFSRLFVKETNETFTSFMTRQKVEWAKQLLEKTDLPISQISDDLGFNESSYFVKTFKKLEQITPSTYRKYMQKE